MKKIIWLIQDVNLRLDHLNEIFNTLLKLGFECKTFGVIPFTNTITGLENALEIDAIYVTICGTKVLSVLTDVEDISEMNDLLDPDQIKNGDYYLKALKDSIFYDISKFDQLNYSTLNLPLLNDNPELYLIGDNMDVSFLEDKFIKPSRDLKAFNGGIIKKGQTIGNFILSQMHQDFYKEEIAIIGNLKEIYSEYRFFVINGEVITASMYKIGKQVKSDPIIPLKMQQAADVYAKLYNPSIVFTMDLADTAEGIKIVEYNCFNCSGHYACDLEKMYTSIANYLLPKIKNDNSKDINIH